MEGGREVNIYREIEVNRGRKRGKFIKKNGGKQREEVR